MNKTVRFAALLFAAMLILISLPVYAQQEGTELWRSDLRRMNDLTDVMSESDADVLNEKACDAVTDNQFDFVIITYDNSEKEDDADTDYIEYLYSHNELGYGANRDGIVLAFNTEDGTFMMLTHGRGMDIFKDEVLFGLSNTVRAGFENGGYVKASDAFLDSAISTVGFSDVEYSDYEEYDSEDYSSFGPTFIKASVNDMPEWYPDNISEWTFTPIAQDAPRVVDDADIFTDDEERQLEEKIAETATKNGADIVIFTDVSTHGLSRSVYAADFYDFSGYGYGEEHDGFCLFICMDPNARGGWCCVTGSRPRELYTEDNANELDDVLYEYLGDGEYFEGVYDWIGNIGTLLDKGVPFAPDWFPSANEEFVRRRDSSVSRVVDTENVISAETEAKLIEKINDIRDKYGVDVVIHTASNTYDLSQSNYIDKFYKYNGYGIGEDYDGVMLSIFPLYSDVEITTFGNVENKLTDRNIELLMDAVEGIEVKDDYDKAVLRWVDYLEATLRTGRTPRTPFVWSMRGIAAAISSLIASSITASKAKKSMVTVRTVYEANAHFVRDSFGVRNTGDRFTHNTVTRVYSPVNRDRDSGGGHSSGSSGGSSSHSSSYSGSSGTSHSGSGRNF